MKRVRRTTSRNRGALSLIAALLAGSALVRLGAGPGEAIAREFSELDREAAPVVGMQTCQSDDDIAQVLSILKKREAQLDEREARIEQRLAVLAEAEAEMEATLAELVAAEQSLEATLSVADTAAEDDLAQLTTVYETMKPKEAAALFEQMAPEFAAGFLARMRPDAAAQVMAGLTPETAYTMSVILAGRNADVPRD